MAQPYCTGPAHIFVGFPARVTRSGATGASISYLGTCAQKPRIKIRKTYKDVPNDLFGDVPMDKSYKGQDAFVGLDLTRWNEPVAQRIDALPGTTRGTEAYGDIGTLMVHEYATVVLYIQFPYASKAAFNLGGMPVGYRFPCAVKMDLEIEPGTDAKVKHYMFHCIRAFSLQGNNIAHILYDHNMTGLPAIN